MNFPLKCSGPGCDREVDNPRFQIEEALVKPAGPLTRRLLVVQRTFSAVCSVRGVVCVTKSGHHITADDPVAYVSESEWQAVTFALLKNCRTL